MRPQNRLKALKELVIGEKDMNNYCVKWYKDWRFWLLFIAVNISGNPGFNVIFPYHAFIIILFIITSYLLIQRQLLVKDFSYIFLWAALFLFQGYYLSEYDLNSAIHIIMKMTIGVLVLLLVKNKFAEYYSDIIYFFCIVSLLCFTYNHLFGVLPYIDLGESMDGGKNYRVTSLVYTQLYNLNVHQLCFRNCGPFWEPGAFQGFINLAIIIELLVNKDRDKRWYIRMLVFVISVITTYSTGGYIVLTLNVIFFLFSNYKLKRSSKIILAVAFLLVALYVFFKTDFLYDKLSNDQSRLGVSSEDLFSGNLLHILFGYGLAEESIAQSNIKSASSVLNLFRYSGLIGFLLYFIPIIGIKTDLKRIFFAVNIFLILMNEPFITAGVIWWSIPLLYPYLTKIQ